MFSSNSSLPRLRIFWVSHLEITNVQNGANPSSTRRSSRAALSQGVPKRTKRVHKMTSTHASVRCSILVFTMLTDIRAAVSEASRDAEAVDVLVCTEAGLASAHGQPRGTISRDGTCHLVLGVWSQEFAEAWRWADRPLRHPSVVYSS